MRGVKAAAAVLAVVAAAYAVLSRFARRVLGRPTKVGDTVIHRLEDDTTSPQEGRAVRSIQSADLEMPAEALDEIWTPMHLERFARTYWRFLSRATLGQGFLLGRFHAVVQDLIQQPQHFSGFRIDSQDVLADIAATVAFADLSQMLRQRLQRRVIEFEIANYYPSIASRISNWFYRVTQSRIHVLVTYGFLRSVAKLDLEESVVGRFATLDEIAVPQQPLPMERTGAQP